MFLNGISFWNQPFFSGEPQIADANFFISFEIILAESRRVMGIFKFVASAIFLWSFIFARTGRLEIFSI